MTITVENTGPCRRTLRVAIEADRVAGTRAEILREFRNQASLPGFRPGKAPEPMVEKRFGKQIDEELHNRLVPESYRQALSDHKLAVVGYPKIEKVDYTPGQPMQYTAVVDIAPDFILPHYKGIELKKKVAQVSDEEIAQSVEALREQQSEFVAVEGRGLRTGDFAVINYSGVADGKPIGQLAPDAASLGEHKDFWVLIASDSFLPGFCDQLLGTTAGDRKQVLIDFPKDFPQKTLAGRKATYFVEVTAIKEKKPPELDDAFAKKCGVDNLAQLKSDLAKGLAAEHDKQAEAGLRQQLIEQLLSKVEFDLPESLVAEETRSIIHEVVRENSQRGIGKEQLEQKKEEILGFATQNAQGRLRASFILDAIARAENIQVEEAEVNQRVAQLAQRYRITPERLKAQLDERNAMGEIEEQLLTAKTLDFLLANAKVEAVAQAEPGQQTAPADQAAPAEKAAPAKAQGGRRTTRKK